jgi:hypothetical protein
MEGRTLSTMLNDASQLLIGLAALVLVAVTLGTLSARLFLSATGGSRK